MHALAKACNHAMAVDSHANTKAAPMSSEREGFAECIILNTTVDPFVNAKAVPNIARVRGFAGSTTSSTTMGLDSDMKTAPTSPEIEGDRKHATAHYQVEGCTNVGQFSGVHGGRPNTKSKDAITLPGREGCAVATAVLTNANTKTAPTSLLGKVCAISTMGDNNLSAVMVAASRPLEPTGDVAYTTQETLAKCQDTTSGDFEMASAFGMVTQESLANRRDATNGDIKTASAFSMVVQEWHARYRDATSRDFKMAYASSMVAEEICGRHQDASSGKFAMGSMFSIRTLKTPGWFKG
ncbi:hypothetical protein PI124_g11812 [Phytophthora idaei]|nr:hypothetical protein PI124_g11812 [Phytophthora idaei]